MTHAMAQVAVFGGGCFWCTEAVFKRLRGVISAEPGYAGGTAKQPTYEEVASGMTGHAEVVRVLFNPDAITYRQLLTVFFAMHDPTTPGRQGSDAGSQYRSIILYADESQKREAESLIDELQSSDFQGTPIVTEVRPLEAFYKAEDYHKDYYERYASRSYCRAVIDPKLKKLRRQFADLMVSHEHSRGDVPEEVYEIAFNKGTEPPFSGAYLDNHERGIYRCAVCGAKLFSSEAKFDSHSGWPSFTDPAARMAIELRPDTSGGMERTEIVCRRCGAHLGHLFNDGPAERGGRRFCVNSACLTFDPRKEV